MAETGNFGKFLESEGDSVINQFNDLPIPRNFDYDERNKSFDQITSENLIKETPEKDRHYLKEGTSIRQVRDGKFKGGKICEEIMVKRVLDENGEWLTSKNGNNKYMALTEFQYWFIKKGSTGKEYRMFKPGENFSAPKEMEKIETPFTDKQKENLPKSKLYGKEEYFVSTVDKRLYGTNQNTFEAYEEQMKIGGKKRNLYIPIENVILFRNGYTTIKERKPVMIEKVK